MKDALRIRQNELNAQAAFRYHDLPAPRCIAMFVDRTLWERTGLFLERLCSIVPGRFERWPFNRNHGTSAVQGWRERVATCSMQIIEHDYGVIEVDFDLCNPNHGLLPAIGHLVEVMTPGKTDPFRVMRGLRRRGLEILDAREL